MRKLVYLAVLLAAFVAVPAFASTQNIKVDGSINSYWLYRTNFDLGTAYLSAEEDPTQNLFLSITTLGVSADLTDNVSAVIQLLNERSWDELSDTDVARSESNNIDINLAFITLREALYSPLTVVIGRQAFRYGNSFIVDSAGTNNNIADGGLNSVAEDLTSRTNQDAIRLIFDYNPLKVELLASKIDANTLTAVQGGAATSDDDIDLYGANISYDVGDDMKTMVETYFFAKIDNSLKTHVTSEVNRADTIYVPGLRASTNPLEGLSVQGEIAWQAGTKVVSTSNAQHGAQQREAVGAQFIANYEVPVLEEYKPMAQYVYTFVSGDDDSSGAAAAPNLANIADGDPTAASREVATAWDPMFENQATGKIYNTLFDLSNAHIHGVSLSANPMEDVTTTFTWTGMWLHQKLLSSATTLGIRNPDGSAPAPAINSGETAVGNEFDFDVLFNYTEDVQIGGSWGWFVPGDLFAVPNQSTAFQSLVNVDVDF